MKKTSIFLLFLLAILFVGLILPKASFSLVLYDDFSATYIDRTKWVYGEFVREIDVGSQKLLIKHATPNPLAVASYPFAESGWSSFINPNSVNSMQADVTVLVSTVVNSAQTRARVAGFWYNDGTPGGSLAGDVWAALEIRSGTSGLFARWEVGKYTDPQGINWQSFGNGNFTTPVNIGTSYPLYLEYDNVNHRFIFRLDYEEIVFGPAGLPAVVGSPNTLLKGIGTRVVMNDTASSGYVSATFDNVCKNGALYDDFASSVIDSAKWTTYEFVREISNGKLRTKVRTGSASSNDPVNCWLPSIVPIKAAQAKVTLLDLQNPQGLYERVGITGAFFNDGTPGEWQIGDVQAVVRIASTWLTLQPEWEVLRCADSECDNTETLATGVFTTPIVLGNTYTLFIEWDGSQFTLKFNDEVAHYTPTSIITMNPAKLPLIDLNTKVHPSPGHKEATIEALYDDVMVNAITCTYSISPTSRSHGSGAGTGSVSVTAQSGCSWTATSNVSWITITSGSSGTGNGTVSYSVSANTSTSSRTGTLTIAGQTFTVSQSGMTCTYSSSPTSQSFNSSGGTGTINVTTQSGCFWSAYRNATWITITSGSNGTGNGIVSYSVSANTSTSSRTGTLTIAGQTFTVTQSGAGGNDTATRDLPNCYTPSVPLLVTITVTPSATTQTYAVEETPPNGWTISNINENGQWDNINKKVKWGPFFDHNNRTLTYKATPPSGETGTKTFSGTASFGGRSVAIGGESSIEKCVSGPHPADTNNDYRMGINEVTAYGSAWKTGQTWPTPPNPIPIEYVTNAAYLWKMGEVYHYDGSVNPPWVSGAAGVQSITRQASLQIPIASGTGSATRTLPSTYEPSMGVNVSISLNPGQGTQVYAVEETPPNGWVISDINENGWWDNVNKKVKWGPFFDANNRTLTYKATPPLGESGIKTFSGTASFDGSNVTISGDSTIGTNVFSDVPPGYWAYDYIIAIYNDGITMGCTQDNPDTPENERRYCPEDNVTRGQMAAFIIRAKYGETFSYTTTPYFTDVPSTHTFFKYVQKLRDDGITAVSGTYAVDSYVTRGQMAAFIIRAKFGETFSYTTTPYFSDVPSTHNFFKYVQKLKDEGITAVTGTYYVNNNVTRAEMAAFLARAFLGME